MNPPTETLPVTPPAPTSPLLRERVGGIALVRLPVEGFDALTLNEKLLAYHLYKASLAGRDITYDQDHRLSLAIRRDLEQVLTHGGSLPRDLLERLRTYTKLFWIGNGPYNERTKRKTAPGFTREEWTMAVKAATAAGASVTTNDAIERLLFEPDFQALMTSKSPPPGEDILTASANNYYEGVSLKDLEGFEEHYALNSKVVKEGGKPVELVWRAGREAREDQRPAPPGGYAKELRNVSNHLRDAMAFAGDAQKETLRELIEHFETGSLDAFDRSNIAWLHDNPRVDLILGFIETYKDARGQKGEWEGVVSMIDARATKLMTAIAENAQYFEDRSPWSDEFKKKGIKVPVAKAIQVIVGNGGCGPSLPAGINLPNKDAIREKYGSKSFLLTNVMRATEQASADASLDEFALPEERDPARRLGGYSLTVHVALHEIVGHGSGKLSKKLEDRDPAIFLKEHANALEELRAELVALHHIFDPKMRELAPECTEECAEVAYRAYARSDFTNLRRVHTARIEDAHMRATHVIVQYAVKKGAVVLEDHDGRHFQTVKDVPAMRAAVAELLAEVMRIKAEGDYDAAKTLFDTYGLHFDPALRDEVVARAKHAGVPDFFAYVMPELRAVKDARGHIVDVQLVPVDDFEGQMLRWSERGPEGF